MARVSPTDVPLLDHPLDEAEDFTASSVIRAVQELRGLASTRVPAVCVLDFDGDLSDKLLYRGTARPFAGWACFHTAMAVFDVDGTACGIVSRTVGGAFAVLVAEQLAASGAQVIVGLTSAGRVRPDVPLPHVVVADEAIRDEGTSYHYLPAARTVRAPSALAQALVDELHGFSLPVTRGLVWTTDAPYRETRSQLRARAEEGALAVEMQAASLFAFAARKVVEVGVVAHVTNALDAAGEPFHKGPDDVDEQLLRALCRAARNRTRFPSDGR